MRKLHLRALPFCLRRLKQQVLSELPAKTIRDVVCDLSGGAQRSLYNEAVGLLKGQVLVRAEAKDDMKRRRDQDAFTQLRELFEICSHPLLVLRRRLEEQSSELLGGALVARQIEACRREGLSASGKFSALVDVLQDASVGVAGEFAESPHRALLFCQWHRTLDLLEELLFEPGRPLAKIKTLRLDGSVPAMERQRLAEKFNKDPSIGVLLLTTSVGGQGLSLTGADVVVFMEHDWNPQNDLQAMDRAHRLGQTRNVSVIRLVTRSTIEEKLMGVHRFKLAVANNVINEDNASAMEGIHCEDIIEALNGDQDHNRGDVGGKRKQEEAEAILMGVPKAVRSILSDVGELWAKEQYDEAFSEEKFHDFAAAGNKM